MARKGEGKEAELSYSGNLLIENRNGLIVNATVWEDQRDGGTRTPLVMLEQIAGTKRVTVAPTKASTPPTLSNCRQMKVTPHVAQNDGRRGGSAIDGRTTRHAGYRVSQRKRKRIEECFGWLKTIALMRKVRHRGLFKVDWVFTFACTAYDLVRLRNLSTTGEVGQFGPKVCLLQAKKAAADSGNKPKRTLSPLVPADRNGTEFGAQNHRFFSSLLDVSEWQFFPV